MLVNSILRTALCLSVTVATERWSRQLPNSGPETDATNDWVPLSQQTDRSNNARVLNYRPEQYEKNGFVLPTDQTQLQRNIPVGQPFQAQGFKAPPKPEPKAFHHSRLPPQRPTSESFFKFEMPFFGNDGSQNEAVPTVQADYQIQHTVPQQTFVTSPLFSQKPVFPPEFHPNYQTQFQPLTQQRPIQQNYVQDIQQQIKEKHVEHKPGLETQQTQAIPPFAGQQSYAKPTAFQAQLSYNNQGQQSPSVAQEEVQLLYVPYDALYPQRPEQITYDGARFNLIPQPVNPVHINNFYTPEPLTNSDPNLFSTSTSPTISSSPQGPSTTPMSFLSPQFTSSQKPKSRPKPHQPPLAMFMQKSSANPSSVVDVVKALSSAKSIAVIDAPTQTAPPLFVGPAGLPSPNGYEKFELPYLSSINRNNIDFLQEIPFFVAPQSYRAPLEFNKISLPEPHVGSIVVNKHLQGVHATQVVKDYQRVPSTTKPPVHHLMREVFVPTTEDSVRYHTSLQTVRTTARPTKLRYQFGTSYSELPEINQNYKQESEIAPAQTQTQQHSQHHNYYQQQYIQEVQSSTTPEPKTSPNYAEILRNADKHLEEAYKYNQQLQQVTSMRPTILESEKDGNSYYKEIHPATSLRPTTLRPKEHSVQNEYFHEQYNQEFVPVTSIRPTLKTKDLPQIEQYNHESYPVTSLRPSTVRSRPQYIEQSTPKPQIVTSERPSLIQAQQQNQNEFYKDPSEGPSLIQVQHQSQNNFYKSTSERPSLMHPQHSNQNDFYKEQYDYQTTPSTSPKPSHSKHRHGQIKFNRAQYNEELQSEISDANNYRDQMQYLSGNYKQDIQSTTRATTPRTKTVDRGRGSYNKRPVEISTQSTYGHFKPMPNNVISEEYFKVQPLKTTSSTSTTTTSTTTTTTTEPPIQQHSSEAIPQPQYAQLSEVAPTVEIKPIPDYYQHKVNSQPSYYFNKDNEEYQMKTYFRQQEAFKNRQSATTPGPIYESVQYTPISFDYPSQLYNIPSTTKSYYEESTRTKPKERITFFAPTPHVEDEPAVVPETPVLPIQHPTVEYNHETEEHQPQTEAVTESTTRHSTTPSIVYHSSTERRRPTHKHHHIPTNHRANYNNEVVYNHDVKTPKEQEKEHELEYEPNPYQLPSELPPLTPNLPGLVNGLLEKEDENDIEKGTTEMEPQTTTTSTTLRPTRRPINRGRRPTIARTHTSAGYSSNYETTTRRPITRARRPYTSRNNYSSQTNQTYASTTPRPLVRNPNRVRYNPSPEERRQYRPRTRIHSKKVTGEEDNLDYQRDVLKQNYPIFKPTRSTPTTATTTTTTTTTTEQPTDIPEVIITITPSSDSSVGGGSNGAASGGVSSGKEQFTGFLEPLQIAHEYQQRHDNYGPGYFPNEEDIIPTEALVEKNEIHELHPVYTTTTTTPEPPRETTRKSLFKRRGSKPTRTTTEAPPTTTFSNEDPYTEKNTKKYNDKSTERYTVRPRVRPERPDRPKVVKIRGRIRKPTTPTHPASTTTVASEKKTPEHGYHQLNRFNQDFYQEGQDDYRDEIAPNNQHQGINYNLETQESQWSPSLSNLNGFRPVDPEERSKFGVKSPQFEDEPEIVTAGSGPSSAGRRNTFSVKVSAGFGPSSYESSKKQEPKDEESSATETSFSDLLEEVMSGVESTYKNQQEEPEEDNSRKVKQTRRKGAWKRVRVTPVDAFETAESQNIGTQIYNTIFASSEHVKVDRNSEDKTTLPSFDITDDYLDVTTLNPAKTNFEIEPHYTEMPSLSEETTIFSEPKLNKTDKSTIKDTDPTIATLEQSIDKGPDEYTDATEYDNLDTVTDTITRRSDEEVTEDLESQPSLFDEVKKQLSSLFTVEEEKDESDPIKSNFQPRKQEYTSIQRIRAMSENSDNKIKDTDKKPDEVTVSPFHKNLMETVVYATSTSTEVSHETEICYRGRCVKTAKKL